MSLASMRLSWKRASTSFMASSMAESGRKAVASHWWVMVPIAVSMYSVRHLAINGMPEKANSRYNAASRTTAAAAAAAIRRPRLEGERVSSFINRASARKITRFYLVSISAGQGCCQGGGKERAPARKPSRYPFGP